MAGAVVAATTLGLIVLGLVMSSRDEGVTFGVNDEALPSIPVEARLVPAIEVPTFFEVVKPRLVTAKPHATALAEASVRPPGARRARQGANKTTSMDVAILSVLVEHIDAERRADRATRRDTK